MNRQSHTQHHSIHRGAAGLAPLFFLGVLLLSGCMSNVRAVADIGLDMVDTFAAAAGTPPPARRAALAAPGSPYGAAAQPDAATPVQTLPLADPLNAMDAEISGLAWHGDRLILLPQYPSRFGGAIFALEKAEISAYLRGDRTEPLRPVRIAFDDGALEDLTPGFEGFEAIAFAGDRAYLTVETRSPLEMLGILVSGEMTLGGSLLSVDPFVQATLPAQAALRNMTDESVVHFGNLVMTLYEANGANVNSQPQARLFDQTTLTSLGSVPLATLEYRLTDATAMDDQGRFWVINYLWPGDIDDLRPATELPDTGPSGVERLVELQITEEGVFPSPTPAITLQLLPGGIFRNWEGVARFEDDELDGFLLVTDRFPTTMLGFVERE